MSYCLLEAMLTVALVEWFVLQVDMSLPAAGCSVSELTGAVWMCGYPDASKCSVVCCLHQIAAVSVNCPYSACIIFC